MKRNKERHYTMIKGSIKVETIKMINIYAPNKGALQYIRKMLASMKGEINSNTIILEDFNNSLTLWIDQLNQKSARKHKL